MKPHIVKKEQDSSVRPFKFLNNPIAYSYTKNPIFAGEIFYSMNKEVITSIGGRIIPKYSIVMRTVPYRYEFKYKPDYNTLFYFNTREEAEFIKERLIHWDEHVKGGEIFNEQSDMTITYNR